MKTIAFLAATITFFYYNLCAASEPRRDRTDEIRINVQANEALYRDIEIVTRKKYRLGEMKDPDPTLDLARSLEEETRHVYQNKMIFIDIDEHGLSVAGIPHQGGGLLGFDGSSERVFDKGSSIANVSNSHQNTMKLLLPHTILMTECARIDFPLSTYLKGGEAARLASHNFYRQQEVSAEFEKEEDIDGLHCVMLRCGTRTKGKPPTSADIRFIWLAVDRNYLPVRIEAYRRDWLGTYPPEEIATVSDWREISPGIWLPFAMNVIDYDPIWLTQDHKKVISNRREIKVVKAILDPKYDVGLFRDIPFPDGTMVYELDNDKIVDSYVQGRPQTTKSRFFFSWRMALVVAACVAVGIGVFFVARRKSRKKLRAKDGA